MNAIAVPDEDGGITRRIAPSRPPGSCAQFVTRHTNTSRSGRRSSSPVHSGSWSPTSPRPTRRRSSADSGPAHSTRHPRPDGRAHDVDATRPAARDRTRCRRRGLRRVGTSDDRAHAPGRDRGPADRECVRRSRVEHTEQGRRPERSAEHEQHGESVPTSHARPATVPDRDPAPGEPTNRGCTTRRCRGELLPESVEHLDNDVGACRVTRPRGIQRADHRASSRVVRRREESLSTPSSRGGCHTHLSRVQSRVTRARVHGRLR